MLEFINNNGVLFSGIFSIIVALFSVLVAVIRDNKKNKLETVKTLRNDLEKAREELQKVKEELTRAKSIEELEKNIDKTHGSIYHEGFSNGDSRTICGFCWEKEHVKIPIATEFCYDEFQKQYYYSGYCNSCKVHCIENVDLEIGETNDDAIEVLDDELPF